MYSQQKLLCDKIPKIYTKTGDSGITSLFNGERRKKNDPIFDALGNLDETSSHIGNIRAQIHDIIFTKSLNHQQIEDILIEIQQQLQDIASHVATPSLTSTSKKLEKVNIDSQCNHFVVKLEKLIDSMNFHLKPLSSFILPSGSKEICAIHIARCVCRRAERSYVT